MMNPGQHANMMHQAPQAKVIKPIKGGGKGNPAINPYGSKVNSTISIKPQSQALSFNEFIAKTAPAASTSQNRRQSKVIAPSPIMPLGNTEAPIIKPEFQQEFIKNLSQQ